MILDELSRIVGAAHVFADDAECMEAARDWRRLGQGVPLCLIRPGSTTEVAAVKPRDQQTPEVKWDC